MTTKLNLIKLNTAIQDVWDELDIELLIDEIVIDDDRIYASLTNDFLTLSRDEVEYFESVGITYHAGDLRFTLTKEVVA